ncbi:MULTISPECIES: sulfate/molybdate ABC transporter ATP-binding protein [Acinetobacter]|jgi:sulfate transport system ATP-binding protein|uniref:Sulfate ABC transporter ATP-binding protein n=2 Tax=Acinetobacter schindleri TaxID=108981 RepID=A0AAE6WTJ3_9GAMM|nr:MULTISPECIES: sulfate ABC transporter ATP-binding protein [Acinetobacter]AWD69179.1 sulfate ABC transporter ATP-binding protein [Acinetobacter schindleri]EIM38002.1 sulfate/thiosulfate import ATP-binding protein cysA(Sulfate-transporting ATPase) [Acinetobacter sp. HA]ENV13164.1 sulfate/thiosulfate import ATP-binding protein CysA [Acinetobacter schindleri NIPH 900]MDP1445527.1 sulfate ABC transporter ATP-binding protein [Acinetobacter schindleri]QIC66738.1 sulfate ABC transporter ATP-binding
MSIQVKNIEKHFGAFHALNNISLDFPDGQLVALLGPSGCGKTTLLRIIAGLESADGGQVILEGQDATNVHVREREVGFVFQHYALFRHMTVYDNVAFGLRVRPRSTRPSETEIKKRVTRLLDLVQLGFLADRYPAQLSGGQRQRIALARALAVEPRVLLLDEPFGALDAKVRKELRRWLRTLHDELHITSIFVTHDQEEALEVADQIVVMNKGNVEQIGSPREVYETPKTPFVFDFLGQANRFEGQNNGGIIQLGEDRIQFAAAQQHPQGDVIVFARPDELRISAQPQDNAIQATFIRELWIAGKVVAELNDRQGNLIEISLTPEEARAHQFRPNQTVWLSPLNLHLFANQVA